MTTDSAEALDYFRVVDVPNGAAEALEQLGSKHAFWLSLESYGRVLFKPARLNTGEHWAEKIACEVAQHLGLPRAQYELARYGDVLGVLSISLVGRRARLVHGNELVVSIENEAASDQINYKKSDNSLRRVLSFFRGAGDAVRPPYGFELPDGVSTALDVFVGYLMFDALIANQDRHEQNWAVLRLEDGCSYLAPTYYHGSSLGRNESDARRVEIMTTRNSQRNITAYVARARSAFYMSNSVDGQKPKPIPTIDAFIEGLKHAPLGGNAWMNRLKELELLDLQRIVARVPESLMSSEAKVFAVEMVMANKARILAIGE